MRLAGYGLGHGIEPGIILGIPRHDRSVYYALMELNQEQELQMLTAAFHNALVMFWEELHRK